MHGMTLQQLRYFDAVVSQGSFHAAAAKLHRSHPTVCAAVSSLEQQLGFQLLDRKGYRVGLTQAGKSFHERVKQVLQEAEDLQRFAQFIARGERLELRIVLDDCCLAKPVLAMLARFLVANKINPPQLHLDSNRQPLECLQQGSAELSFHAGNASDGRFEHVRWESIEMLPVAAPGFTRSAGNGEVSCDQLQSSVQCVVGDCLDHYERLPAALDARRLVVSNHHLKRDAILQRMAWGYLPSLAVADDLRTGRLVSLAGHDFQTAAVQIWVARARAQIHASLVEQLWRHLQTPHHDSLPDSAGVAEAIRSEAAHR